MNQSTASVRLNLGCGRSPRSGWVNVDSVGLRGVDVVTDLDDIGETGLPFAADTVVEFAMSHVLEHLQHTLPLMQELHRVAAPGAVAIIQLPHGASDDAWEDPTHVRAYFPGSFGYFSQPYYWRADYGYRGDWQPERVELRVAEAELERHGVQTMWERIQCERNLVLEMTATLTAVKPIREPLRALQQAPLLVISGVPTA